MIAKYFATSFAIENVVSAPRVTSICLPTSTTSMSLVGIRIEVDHVAGFLRGLRAGVHRHRDVGLRERRRVVGAVAAHRDQPALRLVLADQLELRFRRGFGEEIIDARFGGDRRGREPVVARDHDGLDAHLAQLRETLADAAFDDVAQLDDAEHAPPVGDDERRRARRARWCPRSR